MMANSNKPKEKTEQNQRFIKPPEIRAVAEIAEPELVEEEETSFWCGGSGFFFIYDHGFNLFIELSTIVFILNASVGAARYCLVARF
jgi:hypothetical protein